MKRIKHMIATAPNDLHPVGSIFQTLEGVPAVICAEECDGRFLSKDAFPALHAILGDGHNNSPTLQKRRSLWKLRKFMNMTWYDIIPNPDYRKDQIRLPDLRGRL